MTDAELRSAAEAEYERAFKRLSATGASKASQGVENEFAMAYKRLVALGVRSRLKARYTI